MIRRKSPLARWLESLLNVGGSVRAQLMRLLRATEHLFASGFDRVMERVRSASNLGDRSIADGTSAVAESAANSKALKAVSRFFRTLLSPVTWLFAVLATAVRVSLTWIGEKLSDTFLDRWLRPFYSVWHEITTFAGAWLRTRDYKQLLWASPLLLVLVPLAAALMASRLYTDGEKIAHYRHLFDEALENQEFAKSQLYSRKLSQLGSPTIYVEFQMALALEASGDYAGALEAMHKLAPPDRPGFAPAHRWAAFTLTEQKLDMPRDEALDLAQQHLDHLESLGETSTTVSYIRSRYFARRGDMKKATEEMERAMISFPQLSVELMLLRLQDGDVLGARRAATIVQRYYRDLEQPISADGLVHLAAAHELMGDPKLAEQSLREVLEKEPGHPLATQTMLAMLTRQFDEYMGLPEPTAEGIVDLIQRMAKTAPAHPVVERSIMRLLNRTEQDNDVQRAIEMIGAAPETPGPVLGAVGTRLAVAGDVVRAREYLEEAVRRAPDIPLLQNNLAWMLANSEPRDVDRALALANNAVKDAPDEFRYRETRGQILVQMEQWQPAIADLEFALNGMPNSGEIHAALVSAYEAVGNEELADAHRRE